MTKSGRLGFGRPQHHEATRAYDARLEAIMQNWRLFPSAVVLAVVLLAGCGGIDGDSSNSGSIMGVWTGTWTDSFGNQGTLEITFSEGSIGMRMGSGSCGPAEFDHLFSQFRAFASEGTIDFSVANCDCVGGLGCVFAGGIFSFHGTYGSGHMQGAYEATSNVCSCCSCTANTSGTWDVSRS